MCHIKVYLGKYFNMVKAIILCRSANHQPQTISQPNIIYLLKPLKKLRTNCCQLRRVHTFILHNLIPYANAYYYAFLSHTTFNN